MEIHAKCTWDYEAIKALSHISSFRKTRPSNHLLLFSILIVVIAVLSVLPVFWGGSIRLQYLLLGILLMGFELFLMFGIPGITYKNMGKMQNTVHEFTFGEDSVNIRSSGEAFSGESVVAYALLVKGYETARYFFLFQTKNQAYIVDKATVTGGTPEEIREKLQGVLGKKYKICKY